MDQSNTIRQAITLSKNGDRSSARHLISGILQDDPRNAEAWVIMAQIVDSRVEAIACMKKAINLRPDDQHARRYLEYLEKQGPTGRDQAPPYLVVGVVAALTLLCVIGLFLSGRFPLGGAEASASQPDLTCRALIDEALRMSNETCQSIGRDQVCYGHTTVTASLRPGTTTRFTQAGDILSIEKLTKLSAAPLDLNTRNWGVGIFKFQANLPYTLPGQTVTMIVTGDTSIQNASDSMQAFTFTSRIGGIDCDKVPVDGLIIQTTDGAGIRFQVNGSDLALSGDAYLQANRDGRLWVSMIDGGGWISSDGVSRFIKSGETGSVVLNGLDSDGPPTVDDTQLDNLCLLTGTCNSGEPTRSSDDVIAMIASLTPTTSTQTASAVSPTPTRTPRPSSTPKPPTAQVTPTVSGTPGPTRTPRPSSTPKPTLTKTSTGMPNASQTPSPSPSPTSTRTPTLTPTSTLTPSLTPAPTNTLTPSPEPTLTPTDTQPPTATEVPTCDNISGGWRRILNQTAQFWFMNTNSSEVNLTGVAIEWPQENGSLIVLGFRGQFTADEVPGIPAAPPAFKTAVSGPKAVLRSNRQSDLQFKFETIPVDTGYTVVAVFDIGCEITLTH